jgi:hypothetical protein
MTFPKGRRAISSMPEAFATQSLTAQCSCKTARTLVLIQGKYCGASRSDHGRGGVDKIDQRVKLLRFFCPTEMYRSPDDQTRTQVAELFFGGFSEITKQNADQVFEVVGLAEDLRLSE